jgi:hypothetical protein
MRRLAGEKTDRMTRQRPKCAAADACSYRASQPDRARHSDADGAATSLAAALSRDQAVKRFDLRVEQLEGLLPVDAVSAEGGSLARGHRLEEIRAIGAAALLAVTRVDTALADCCPAKASGGEIGELTATRHFGPGSYRWIDQKSDGKNDDAQHGRSSESLSPDCRRRAEKMSYDLEAITDDAVDALDPLRQLGSRRTAQQLSSSLVISI